MIRAMKKRADQHAHKLLIAGVAAIWAQNWRWWLRDQQAIARIRAERSMLPTLRHAPRVSVLVAAWNERDHIDAHIESFLALPYPALELILCAGGADGTFEQAQRYASDRVIVLEQHGGAGKQHSLARCLEYATGAIMYLTDADCRYDHVALTQLLAPLINEGEQAATGGSRPLAAQADKLLPRVVWAADVVSSARSGAYSNGMLGRNAAVTRHALHKIGGLAWEARTGTDYQLAQRLIAAGVSIRYVGASVVESEYAESARVYRHKQSRWLRNVLIHGPRFGARADVRATRRTVATGLAMLLAPFASLVLGRAVLALWAVLTLHAATAKLRYAVFAARLHGLALPWRVLAAALPLALLDFAVWASPIVDLLHPGRRDRW